MASNTSESAERARLVAEIATLRAAIRRAEIEQQNLIIELDFLIGAGFALATKTIKMDKIVDDALSKTEDLVTDADVDVSELNNLITELSETYFKFKNLSTATKNLTQLTDLYHTKFNFFNKLRRVAIGYIVALDLHILTSETVRKEVEAIYLKNSEYWLAYALMSVMLWSKNEKEAAQRAVEKALSIDYNSAALFYLLVNLRFNRLEAAKKWYMCYLDRVDIENITSEWQYLLLAYLLGVFGSDKEFNFKVKNYLLDMLNNIEIMHPDYGDNVILDIKKFAFDYVHVTDVKFGYLRRFSPEYEQMNEQLTLAEKNMELAIYFKTALEAKDELGEDLSQRIEKILYELIEKYDREEKKVIDEMKYNEMVIKAKGDMNLAKDFYNEYYKNRKEKVTLGELIYQWAIGTSGEKVSIEIKKFSLKYLSKWIVKGFESFANEYRAKFKDRYLIKIGDWQKECDENSFDEGRREIAELYLRDSLKMMFKDKYMFWFTMMLVASITAINFLFLKYNEIVLVIAVLVGALGIFLMWRRYVELEVILDKQRDDDILSLKNTIKDIQKWKELYKKEDIKNEELLNIFKALSEDKE